MSIHLSWYEFYGAIAKKKKKKANCWMVRVYTTVENERV